MGSTKAKQNELVYIPFTVFNTDYVTPLAGQAGSCTYNLTLNNANASETVTIAEIGTTGYYYASFTPLSLGRYSLDITCPDGRVLSEDLIVEVNDLDDIVTEVNANETKIDAIQSDVDDILADTNEMQIKLPTNNIMGSSVKTDKDDEIDAILTDTNEIQGKLPVNDIADQTLIDTDLTNIENKIDTIDTNIDDILIDTNEIQSKLPTNNIMGSSDKTDKNDEIDAILDDTSTSIPATLATLATEANATTNTANIITEVNANEIKIDAIQGDVTDILVDTNEIQGKLPANNIADQTLIDTDLTNIEAKIDIIDANVDTILLNLARALGLVQENFFMDNTTHNSKDRMLTARVRTYTDAVSVGTVSNVLAAYEITATYDVTGENVQTYKVVKQ